MLSRTEEGCRLRPCQRPEGHRPVHPGQRQEGELPRQLPCCFLQPPKRRQASRDEVVGVYVTAAAGSVVLVEDSCKGRLGANWSFSAWRSTIVAAQEERLLNYVTRLEGSVFAWGLRPIGRLRVSCVYILRGPVSPRMAGLHPCLMSRVSRKEEKNS